MKLRQLPFPSPSAAAATAEALQPPVYAPAEPDSFLAFRRIPIPIHSMGRDGLLLDVNEAWTEFTGYTRAQAVGRSFAEFLDPSSASLYRRKTVPGLIGTAPARETWSDEYRLIKSPGEVADIVLTTRPERDPATGRFQHSLTVINDITARNRAEAALRQAQKLEALGSLTSGVAHDFNNLLMIILGSLELLAKRLPTDDARAARLVDTALKGATRGAALTARLLAFARQQESAPRSVNPRALIAALHPMLAHLLGAAIRIEEELPASLWNLRADPNQLELALINLAANARDAMPSGGRLCLAARNATVAPDDGATFIGRRQPSAAPGAYVVLTVSDTGTGMDAAALARAADPFFTTKGPGKGTGLGLSMVHGFAVQSGGALLLSSSPGNGTSVELWLPRTAEPVADPVVEPGAEASMSPSTSPISPIAPPLPTTRRLRILLVDDDPLIVAGTTGMLEELGHDAVRTAASGEAALALLRQDGEFDLLLTDHMMPGMSGVELAARARGLRPSLPILLVSGFAELDSLVGVAWPWLRKPYSLDDLSAALALLGSATK